MYYDTVNMILIFP